jgi:hypothetical protein
MWLWVVVAVVAVMVANNITIILINSSMLVFVMIEMTILQSKDNVVAMTVI